jgi:GTP-sensing pleiotropic transcriptional regulator CodY
MVRGGSAVISRNNIKHFEEEKYVTCDIQATIVTLETSKQRLTVSAIYCPPRYN